MHLQLSLFSIPPDGCVVHPMAVTHPALNKIFYISIEGRSLLESHYASTAERDQFCEELAGSAGEEFAPILPFSISQLQQLQ
jgi:hypothetical protein